MPITPINFAGIEPLGTLGNGDIFSNLLKMRQAQEAAEDRSIKSEGLKHRNTILGAEAQYAPEMQQHAATIKETEAKYAQQMQAAKLAEMLAHTQHLKQSNEMGRYTGPAAEAFSLHMLEKKLGTEHPVVQSAKRKYELGNESKEILNDYRKVLNENADKRFSTPLGKYQQELQDIQNGILPGTRDNPVPITPEQQQTLAGIFENKIIKETTDTNVRQRNIAATNIEKTISNMNVDDLVRYSGGIGGILKKVEEGKSLVGKESEEYAKFKENLVGVKFLAEQVRQFYSGSVQPEEIKKLEKLANPSEWTTSPATAKRQFNKAIDILKQELGTYRSVMKTPKAYLGEEENNKTPEASSNDPFGIR